MLDLSLIELGTIAGAALLIIKPEDLPGALRNIGRQLGKLTRAGKEFNAILQGDELVEATKPSTLVGDDGNVYPAYDVEDALGDIPSHTLSTAEEENAEDDNDTEALDAIPDALENTAETEAEPEKPEEDNTPLSEADVMDEIAAAIMAQNADEADNILSEIQKMIEEDASGDDDALLRNTGREALLEIETMQRAQAVTQSAAAVTAPTLAIKEDTNNNSEQHSILQDIRSAILSEAEIASSAPNITKDKLAASSEAASSRYNTTPSTPHFITQQRPNPTKQVEAPVTPLQDDDALDDMIEKINESVEHDALPTPAIGAEIVKEEQAAETEEHSNKNHHIGEIAAREMRNTDSRIGEFSPAPREQVHSLTEMEKSDEADDILELTDAMQVTANDNDDVTINDNADAEDDILELYHIGQMHG